MTAPRTDPRASTARRHDALRTALVDAAERAIVAGGLPALRARALADAAGCSVGAIYTIFADIDGIVLAVNARTLAAIDAALGPVRAADPTAHLAGLAAAYLDYAASNRRRWAALFLHTMPPGRPAPDWYLRQRDAAFSHVEAPLASLCPALAGPARALLARSLFAAVHGVVALGLDEKVAEIALPSLHAQLETVVTALARGLVG